MEKGVTMSKCLSFIREFIYLTGLRWLWVAVVAFLLDVFSKQWVLSQLVLAQPKPLTSWLNLFYNCNYGSAFGIVSNEDGWQRWIFTGISIFIVSILLTIMYQNSVQNSINNIAFSFIIGGAIGNIFDRLYHGFVIDFIDFYIINFHYPTFNIADSFICIGAVMIVLEDYLSLENEKVKKGE